MSRATLYRGFAEVGGVTAYITSRKLQRIRHLLTRVDAPSVKAIAGAFGFRSASHLSKLFVRAYQTPPGRWHNQWRSPPSGTVEAPRD